MIENLLSEHDIALNVIAKGKQPALTKISVGLAQCAGITERTILSDLLAREKMGTTAFGNGIAVPHALLNELSHPVASLTRLSAPIDFDAPDDSQVDLLLTLLWPRRDTHQFLSTLASVSRIAASFSEKHCVRPARSPAETFAIMCFEPMRFAMSAQSRCRAMPTPLVRSNRQHLTLPQRCSRYISSDRRTQRTPDPFRSCDRETVLVTSSD